LDAQGLNLATKSDQQITAPQLDVIYPDVKGSVCPDVGHTCSQFTHQRGCDQKWTQETMGQYNLFSAKAQKKRPKGRSGW